jgi:choline-glycine betaine transporter
MRFLARLFGYLVIAAGAVVLIGCSVLILSLAAIQLLVVILAMPGVFVQLATAVSLIGLVSIAVSLLKQLAQTYTKNSGNWLNSRRK